ncbi:hypothetical protein LINGRAHAP2_LOCUS33350 [Linum grandiflorum]
MESSYLASNYLVWTFEITIFAARSRYMRRNSSPSIW